MEPEPTIGRVYEAEVLVGPGDVDPRGDSHLDVCARWMQDTGFADLVDAAPDPGAAWIVRRTRLRVEQLPRYCERLTLRTWCSATAASLAERRTSLRGHLGAAVEAEAVWIFVDAEAHVPLRLTEPFHEVYGPSAAGRRARGKLHHPRAPDDAAIASWQFSAADLDIAGHVNNTIYWRVAEVFLAAAGGTFEIEVEHRAELGAGSAIVRHSDNSVWIENAASELCCSFVRTTG